MWKKGEKVAVILRCAGVETCSVQTIESVKKGVVRCTNSSLLYDARTGCEIEPSTMASARLVRLEA